MKELLELITNPAKKEQCDKALDEAIESLGKTIPQKVIYSICNNGKKNATCPRCGYMMVEHYQNWEAPYCCGCGQRLDWRKEEEKCIWLK